MRGARDLLHLLCAIWQKSAISAIQNEIRFGWPVHFVDPQYDIICVRWDQGGEERGKHMTCVREEGVRQEKGESKCSKTERVARNQAGSWSAGMDDRGRAENNSGRPFQNLSLFCVDASWGRVALCHCGRTGRFVSFHRRVALCLSTCMYIYIYIYKHRYITKLSASFPFVSLLRFGKHGCHPQATSLQYKLIKTTN